MGILFLTPYSIPFSVIYYTTIGYSFKDSLSLSNYFYIYSDTVELKIRDVYYAFSMGSKPIALFYGYFIPVFGTGVNYGYSDTNYDPVYYTNTPSSFSIKLLPSLSYSDEYLYGIGFKLFTYDAGNYFIYTDLEENISSIHFYCQWFLSLFGKIEDTEIISGISYYLDREITVSIRTFLNPFNYYFFIQSDIGKYITFTLDTKIFTVTYDTMNYYFLNNYMKIKIGNFAVYHSYREHDETVMYEYPLDHSAGLYYYKSNFLSGFYFSELKNIGLLYLKLDDLELLQNFFGSIYFSCNTLHLGYEYNLKIEYKIKDIVSIALDNESIYFIHLYLRFMVMDNNEKIYIDIITGINLSNDEEDYYVLPSYIQYDYLCLRINPNYEWVSFAVAYKNSITMYIKIILLFTDNVINKRLYVGILADL